MTNFTEQDTYNFYNIQRDKLYRKIWHKQGLLHWGWFEENTQSIDLNKASFQKAMIRLNRFMLKQLKKFACTHVLDAGCGNGIADLWFVRHGNFNLYGVDLNANRINSAKAYAASFPMLAQRLHFEIASLTNLPFGVAEFNGVISQSALYHVQDKLTALNEIARVLQQSGVFIFDDLVKPKAKISTLAQKYVYERLKFDTDFSFTTYPKALANIGFELITANDLTPSLFLSYKYLEQQANTFSNDAACQQIAYEFAMMARAIEQQDVGWALYCLRKLR